jgi:hypothetical protein
VGKIALSPAGRVPRSFSAPYTRAELSILLASTSSNASGGTLTQTLASPRDTNSGCGRDVE